MQRVGKVEIDRLIFHLVVPGPDVVYSTQEVPVDNLVEDFFGDHIENAINDDAAKAARFTNPDGPTGSLCRDALADGTTFISGSQQLARMLHDIMARDNRISVGNMAMAVFHDSLSTARRLAILKFDPSLIARPVTVGDTVNNQYIKFDVQANGLPTSGEKLQKCAFVQQTATVDGQEYSLLLIDRQTHGDEIAGFFRDRFLGAEVVLSAMRRSFLFYTAVTSAVNTLFSSRRVDDAQKRVLEAETKRALDQDTLNVNDWLTALPLPETDKEVFRQALTNKLTDWHFVVDRDYARGLGRKLRYRAAHGFKLEAEQDQFGTAIVATPPPPGSKVWHITIDIEDWEPDPR